MAKKKLLNESQVRRFMGLAGMKPMTVSNIISEMYKEEDPDPADMEMDAAEPAGEMPPVGEEPAGEMPDMDDGDLDLEPDEIQKAFAGLEDAMSLMQQLKDAIGAEGDMGDMDDMEDKDEMGDMDDMEDKDDMEEAMYKADRDEDEKKEEGIYKKDHKEKKEMMDEELSEVDLQLSEEEIVQEVARRVAKRIIKAKRAKKALDEALGRK